MPINEINNVLEKFSDWYTSYDFTNVHEDEKKELITNKFIELGIFNIDFGDMDYFNNNLSAKASEIAYKLKKLFIENVTEEKKINQLLNNPNIIKFAAEIGKLSVDHHNEAIDNLLDICNKQDVASVMGIKSLLIGRDSIIYCDKKDDDFYNLTLGLRDFFNSVEIKENDAAQADQLIKEIIDLSLSMHNQDANSEWIYLETSSSLIKNLSNDDLKIEFILETLKNRYNEEYYCGLIELVKDFDKRLELCRKTVDYQKTVGKEYLKNFMVSFIFKDTMKVNDKDGARYLISKLQEVMADEKLKSYVNSYTIAGIFEAIKNDSALIFAYNEMIKNPSVAELFQSDVYIKFVDCIEDDRLRCRIVNYFIENKILNIIQSIDLLMKVKDRTLLLDYSLMKSIYTNPNFKSSIVEVASQNYRIAEYLKEDETKYIQEGKIEELLEKYRTLGFIDNATLKEIYNIASKYIKNLTMEDLINRISSNPNAKEIIQDIVRQDRIHNRWVSPDGTEKTNYQYELIKFSKIFPKTRFGSLPDIASYKKMNGIMCQNFNLKTWNQLLQNPLFVQDDNTKRALVEIIAMAGLFENDPNVESRKRQIINLFDNYSLPLSKEEMDSLGISDNEWITRRFDPTIIKKYKLRDGINIPDNFASWLSENLSMEQMSRIKKETGNIGSELTKYVSPYVRFENGWKLRNGIQIDLYYPYLKPEMTNEEYISLLSSPDTPREVINFINPYEEIKEQGYKMKQSLSGSERAEVIQLLLESNLSNRYTYESLHRMFDGLDLSFDPDFYQFFLDNQDQILASPEIQSKLKDAKRKFNVFKKYYASRGNHNPNYNDMIEYLKEAPYTVTFGNEEFAQDAKNTMVSDDGYAFYEGLLQETRKRHLTTVPRHEKIYEYVASDGKKYQVIAKVLRADDPFNLLVGESKFTNCCQRYATTGEPCMKHASTSQNGGIFATYLIEDGVPKMLTQSWFWTNEAKACLDNVEATKLITEADGDKKKLLQDIATFAIKSSCVDMINSSKETVDAYIAYRTKRIMKSSLSEKEKLEELRQLEVVRQRQTIKIITVGDGCDDLRVKESFTKIESEEKSYGPKGYDGYRDSTGDEYHKQHIIIQTDDEILPPNDEYVDIPMFRDDRQISIEAADDIRYETLRKITDIESIAHKTQMVQYIKDGEYTIKKPELLAQLYGCYLDDLRVIAGEDWYYVYSDGESGIEVYDLAKKEPRLPDEGMSQTIEMVQAFEKILSDSIVLDSSGSIKEIKPIKADLREDTSYLLYLTQMKRGVIEQIGDDVAYSYADNSNETIISKEQQQQILSNSKEIRDNQNPDMIMHKVVFRPTAKKIEKLLERKIEESKNVGRAK